MVEETIGVDGINVRYEAEGAGDGLLLVHGLGIGRGAWGRVIADVAKQYAVYAVDLPGFGGSDMPDVPYSVPYYAAFLDRLMGQLKLEKAAVAGVSMGGAIAATLAARFPGRVSKLVLVAPSGLTPPQGELVKPSRFTDASFWLLAHNKDTFQRAMEDLFYDRSKLAPAAVDEAWGRMRNPEHRRALLRNTQYLSKADPAFPGLLASIAAPTLIAWGEEDRIVPPSDAGQFADLIRQSNIVMFPKCGHAVPVEKGEALADAMLAFLGEEDRYYE